LYVSPAVTGISNSVWKLLAHGPQSSQPVTQIGLSQDPEKTEILVSQVAPSQVDTVGCPEIDTLPEGQETIEGATNVYQTPGAVTSVPQ